MSNDGTETATADPVTSAVVQAPTGCAHYAKLVTVAGTKLEAFIVRAKEGALAKSGKPGEPRDPKRQAYSLGPCYACLQCPELGSLDFISSHSKKEKHRISLNIRSGQMYCAFCKDIIYDNTADQVHIHGSVQADNPKKRKFWDVDSDSHISTNSTKTPCGREGVRGLFNLGQTCYMNSVLQSLLHDPILISYFLGERHRFNTCRIEDCMGCAMTETFAECRAPDKQDGFPALSLLLASWKQIPTLAGYDQRDAHEYYQALVDKMHESTSPNFGSDGYCKCFFHKVFFGRLRSTITCNGCGEKRKTDDPFNDLNLHMEIQQVVKKKEKANGISNGTTTKDSPTLGSCLDSYTAKEKLIAKCKNCGNVEKSATKQLKIRKLPAILVMQMKRFNSGSESSKIEGKVDFPLTLDMRPYTTETSSPTTTKPTTSTTTPKPPIAPAPLSEIERYTYDLTSVIVHKGSLDSGHYYAYCRESFSSSSFSSSPSSSSGVSQNWYLFNDDRVTLATTQEVLSADAYLLFYGLRWLAPSRPGVGEVIRSRVDESSSEEESD